LKIKMQGHRVTVTLMNDPAAAEAADVADALQAAYFRRSLCDERAHLLAEISKRRDDIATRAERGSTYARHRLGSHLRSAEAQVRTEIGGTTR
jgi:hypothetical protein